MPKTKIHPNASCYLCNSREHLHRHHIDWDHSNNALSNILLFLCQRCHTEHHKGGYLSAQEFEALRAEIMARDPSRFEDGQEKQPGAQLSLFK
jgi:hypothetical protein